MFWLLVVCVGAIGAVADIILSRWSANATTGEWLLSALAYLVFMTGLGLVIRFGAYGGHRLTIAVLLVVLVNVALLAAWDEFKAIPLSPIQWGGVVLALAAVACFELGR